jgi:hypothetical protein
MAQWSGKVPQVDETKLAEFATTPKILTPPIQPPSIPQPSLDLVQKLVGDRFQVRLRSLNMLIRKESSIEEISNPQTY